MKVSTLIAKLDAFDPDASVRIADAYNGSRSVGTVVQLKKQTTARGSKVVSITGTFTS